VKNYFQKASNKWKNNEIAIQRRTSASVAWQTLTFRGTLKVLLALILLLCGTEKSFASLPVPDEIYRGYQLVQDWDIASAEKLSKQLLKKYPESGDAHFLQARIEFMKGNYDRSGIFFAKSVTTLDRSKNSKTMSMPPVELPKISFQEKPNILSFILRKGLTKS